MTGVTNPSTDEFHEVGLIVRALMETGKAPKKFNRACLEKAILIFFHQKEASNKLSVIMYERHKRHRKQNEAMKHHLKVTYGDDTSIESMEAHLREDIKKRDAEEAKRCR